MARHKKQLEAFASILLGENASSFQVMLVSISM